MPLPRAVIVGRHNVGKSSLLNWIVGRQVAAVNVKPGRHPAQVGSLARIGRAGEHRYAEMIDTAAFEVFNDHVLPDHSLRQFDRLVEAADLIVFVVDAVEGLTPLDVAIASRLRYVKTPIILVLNKADDRMPVHHGPEFAGLGRGRPIDVSVRSGRKRDELLALIGEMMLAHPARGDPGGMKLAVLGAPGTGKSTIVEAWARAEGAQAEAQPGCESGTYDIDLTLNGHSFHVVGTDGLGRRTPAPTGLSLDHAPQASRRADVALLLIDPARGLTRVEQRLAEDLARQYKPCIFVVNKWDTVGGGSAASADAALRRYATAVQHTFRGMSYAPLAFTEALAGTNLMAVLEQAGALYEQARGWEGTTALNKALREAIASRSLEASWAKQPKVFSAVQVGASPPTIVLHVNRTSDFAPSYQRWLLDALRARLSFRNVPIKMYLCPQAPPSRPIGAEGASAPHVGDPEPELLWRDLDHLDLEVNELLREPSRS